MVQQVGMNTQACHWDPSEFLDVDNATISYALLVLNTPILHKRDFLLSLWKKASVRITVDGGTNRWYKFCEKEKSENCPLPDMITGDLDSINRDLLKQFKSQGVDVIETPDQNETDFTKALNQLYVYVRRNHVKLGAVIALVDASGRLDQIIANLNTLFKADEILGEVPVFLLGKNSLTWLLRPGSHCICVLPELVDAGRWCSLMPVGAPATVTTTGLKWNLEEGVMQFGSLVSTSNTYSNVSVVTVVTDSCLVWSMGLNDDDDDDC